MNRVEDGLSEDDLYELVRDFLRAQKGRVASLSVKKIEWFHRIQLKQPEKFKLGYMLSSTHSIYDSDGRLWTKSHVEPRNRRKSRRYIFIRDDGPRQGR